MEQFRLLRIEVTDMCRDAEDKNGLFGIDIKVIYGSLIIASSYPFTPVFVPISRHNPSLDFLVFESLSEVARVQISADNLKDNIPTDIDVPCSLTNFTKFSISLELFSPATDTESLIPQSLLEKYQKNLEGIPCIKALLIESLDEMASEIGPASVHALALDLSMLSSTEPMNQQQAEHLKEIILGLNEKLKLLHAFKIILEATNQKAKLDLVARELMQEETRKAWKSMDDMKLRQELLIKNMQDTVNKSQNALDAQMIKNRELDGIINDINGKNKILEGQILELKSELKNFDDMEKMIRDLQTNIKNLEDSRNAMRNDFLKLQSEHDKLSEEKDCEYQAVISKNEELEKILEDRQTEIFSLKNTISSHESLISKQNSEIESYLAEIKGFKDQETKAATMESLSKKHQQECIKSHENMQKTTSKFSEVIKNINQEKLKLLKTTCDQQSTIKQLNESIHSLEEKLNAESLLCKDLRSQNESFQATIYSGIDSQHISRQLLKLYSDFTKSKQIFSIDSETTAAILLEMSEELITFFRVIEQLKILIESRDQEILILKYIITELQKKIPYVAAKNDPVDAAMADYVNSLQEPLEVPFVREDPGIYLFGSKRIYVKLDNDKLSSKDYVVRVGGGSILLDQYVESYTPNELAKMIERRRKKSNSGKKNLMGKILEKISKGYVAGEKAPKNNEVNSPAKAAKMIMEVTGRNRNTSPPRRNSSKPNFEGKSPVKQLSRGLTSYEKFNT